MHIDKEYRQTQWFQFLDHGMKDLISQTVTLLREEQHNKKSRFHDYAYLVFPTARAYEGFLKKFFQELRLIDEQDLLNPHFRIGRSLNPDLPEKYRDNDWLYGDLEELCRECKANNLAERMWLSWKQGRNQLFHYYFPDHVKFISFVEAEKIIVEMFTIMEEALACELTNRG